MNINDMNIFSVAIAATAFSLGYFSGLVLQPQLVLYIITKEGNVGTNLPGSTNGEEN